MARISWVAGIVLLLAAVGCSEKPEASTGVAESGAGTSTEMEAARQVAKDADEDAEEHADEDAGPAISQPIEPADSAATGDASGVQLNAAGNARPDDDPTGLPPDTPAGTESEVGAEASRWLAGMLGDAEQRLESIERLDAMGDEAIAAATQLLRTGQAEARRGAAAYLGIRVSPRDEEAIGELCKALNDDDSSVRQEALQAIDRLPKSQLVYALAGLTALAERADEEATLRVLALRKLGSLGGDGRMASETLVRLGREDESPKVRIAAFSTLSKVAEPEFAEKFYVERLANSQEADERRLAARWLGQVTMTAAGLDGLVTAFADSEKEVRMAAAEALVEIGKPAVGALAQGLEAPQPQVRQYSAFALGKLGRLAAGAIDQLRRATRDEDEQVRRVAEAALRLVEQG